MRDELVGNTHFRILHGGAIASILDIEGAFVLAIDGAWRPETLSPSTALVLKEHQEKQKIERAKFGISPSCDDTLVFCHSDGSPILPDNVTHAWIKLTRRIGLRGIRLHDAMHTHASLLLKQGVHPKIVQERLGHSTIQMTLDTYSHVAPGLQEAVTKRFDEFLICEAKKESVEKFG